MLGSQFERLLGSHQWVTDEELHTWLRDSDAIVLWYDDDPTAGESAAMWTAVATRRPVFVNDTTWFRHEPGRTESVRKMRSLAQLEHELRELFVDRDTEQRSWDAIARLYVADYRAAAEARAQKSGKRGALRTRLRGRVFAAGDPRPLIARKRQLLRKSTMLRAGE